MTFIRKPFLFLVILFFFGLSCNSYAEERKFITILEFMKTRPNMKDPREWYIVTLRCAVVYSITYNYAKRNNMNVEGIKNIRDFFVDDMLRLAKGLNKESDILKEDLARYNKIYEDKMLENHALTGNYFSEPTLEEDTATCRAFKDTSK